MPFFKKERGGPAIGGKHADGKKGKAGMGPQHHLLGNDGTNGKIPITKKAKNIIG